MNGKILEVINLEVSLINKKNTVQAILQNINFHVNEGECLGILGESGSGKSMCMKAILGLLNPNFQVSGSAVFAERDLFKQSKETLRQFRGRQISMILQNPMTCFDPLYTIENQIYESFLAHEKINKKLLKQKALELLWKMKLNDPEEILKKYPHQLSGGMLQRITIGLALAANPDLIVADEPTTAIDAITQFEIMKEFEAIKQRKTAMIFISHDLSVISQIADRIMILKQGKIVDEGDMNHIMNYSEDIYTKKLVRSKILVMDKYHEMLGKD